MTYATLLQFRADFPHLAAATPWEITELCRFLGESFFGEVL